MDASLAGRRVLVTSGPTRGNIDAVRYVTNRSSGRLGCRIAAEALRRGAVVTLVAGPRCPVPSAPDVSDEEAARLHVLPVVTVGDLMALMERELLSGARPEVIIHAMAVLDYVPEIISDEKVPSGRQHWDIRLVRTPKVIRRIKSWAPKAFLVEFKLEVGATEGQLREVAIASMHMNRADLVVANDLSNIGEDTHAAQIIAPDGAILARPTTKDEIAVQLCDVLAERLPTH